MTFAMIVAAFYILQQILPAALLLKFLRASKFFEIRHGRRPDRTEGISVLMPVKGPQPDLEQVLQSILQQDYAGPVEILLAFQDANDPDLAIGRRLEAKYFEHPSRGVRVLEGLPALGLNLKNSNLEHARRVARFEWLYCCDADTSLEPRHLRRALTLAQKHRDKAEACFITAISVHQKPAQAGALLEAVGTNMEFANYFLLSHLSPKTGALNGASMFFHRDLLKKVGTFAAFLDKITDDLAMQRAFVQAGAKSLLLPSLTKVTLEQQTLTGFFQRQLRWQLIVRCFDPMVFYVLAPLNWVGQWMLLFGALLGEPKLMGLGVVVLLVRLARSFMFQIGLGTPLADWAKSLALPVYDLVSPLIWLNTIFVSRVVWAGVPLSVARDGSLEAMDYISGEEMQNG